MRAVLMTAFILGCASSHPTRTEVVHDPIPRKRWCIDESKCSPNIGHCLKNC